MIMIVYPVPDSRNAYHPSPSPSSQEKKWRPLVQRAITAFLKEAHIFYFLLILCQSVIWNVFFLSFSTFYFKLDQVLATMKDFPRAW